MVAFYYTEAATGAQKHQSLWTRPIGRARCFDYAVRTAQLSSARPLSVAGACILGPQHTGHDQTSHLVSPSAPIEQTY